MIEDALCLSMHPIFKMPDAREKILRPNDKDLVPPYGGDLVDLFVDDEEERRELQKRAEELPVVRLSRRSVCDLELLATGAFSPLDRFMSAADHERVVGEMRLTDGVLFPVPVTLPVADGSVARPGTEVVLCDPRNEPLAIMPVDEVFEWDRLEFARQVLGTTSDRHPLVAEMARWGDFFISGRPRVFRLPRYYDFPGLRLTPRQVRERLGRLNCPHVVAFQTRNPLHRAHEEMTKRAMADADAVLLMHPVVGMTKPGDIDHYSRVRSYQTLIERHYPAGRVVLSLLPLAMRFAGPREALWHAIIRRNFGADHFIVGRDHASPGSDENGRAFYPPDGGRLLVQQFGDEIGVRAIAFDEFVYLPESDEYVEISKVPDAGKYVYLSGTEARTEYLDKGRQLPEWFMRPEVASILQESVLPRHRQGICIWFTGLSGSGKSTTAEVLTALLQQCGRRVTLLDGDIVRTNLSQGLGFDRAGRIANIRRIGFVAAEIVGHGGVAICAAISPYRVTRNEVREMIGDDKFIEVFVDTPLSVCEQRDPKGMYAKARRGEIRDFTGIDDLYERPVKAEITLDTIQNSAEDNAVLIRRYLIDKGFVQEDSSG